MTWADFKLKAKIEAPILLSCCMRNPGPMLVRSIRCSSSACSSPVFSRICSSVGEGCSRSTVNSKESSDVEWAIRHLQCG